jgi:hypothetical protein
MGKQSIILEDHTYAALFRRECRPSRRYRDAADLDLPVVRVMKTGDEA